MGISRQYSISSKLGNKRPWHLLQTIWGGYTNWRPKQSKKKRLFLNTLTFSTKSSLVNLYTRHGQIKKVNEKRTLAQMASLIKPW